VYFAETADWIWLPFGAVSGVIQAMGVLDWGRRATTGRGE